MTGEGLAYKPRVVERAKFEYSPLGEALNKELNKKDKKEGLLKRLKNIEGKNEEQLKNQLKLIENNSSDKNSFKGIRFLSNISEEAKEVLHKIKELNNEINYNKLVRVHTNGRVYTFIIFRRLENLTRDIFSADISIKQVKTRQNEMENLLSSLNRYSPQNAQKIRCRAKTLSNAKRFLVEEK